METNNNVIYSTINNFFQDKVVTDQNINLNQNKNNLNVNKERLNLLINNRNIENLNNKSNNYLDLEQSFDSIKFEEKELIKKEFYKKEKHLSKYLDNYTKENLLDENTSDLCIKSYDKEDNELYISDTNEYDYFKTFIFSGKYISENNKSKIKDSKCGRIIIDSYYRFLNSQNRIDVEINEFLKNVEFDDYRVIKKNNNEYGFVLKNLQKQYKYEILERYKYFGTILVCKNNKELVRVPIYLDNNLDFCTLTYRKIVKNYFSFINISKLLTFIDLDIENDFTRLTCVEKFNIFSYKILQKGLIQYYDYDTYNNKEFLDKLYTLEEDSY